MMVVVMMMKVVVMMMVKVMMMMTMMMMATTAKPRERPICGGDPKMRRALDAGAERKRTEYRCKDDDDDDSRWGDHR